MRELVLRADATAAVGAGHAMRCLVLAQAWIARGGSARLWGDIEIDFVLTEAKRAAVAVTTGASTPADVLIVDSYDPSKRATALTSAAKLRVLVDDEGGRVPEEADAVWNPNAYGTAALYSGADRPLISGAVAVPIRSGLPTWSASGSKLVAVSLGASRRAADYSESFAQAAAMCPELTFGTSGKWAPAGWQRIDPQEFWNTAAKARCLVTAAGTTVWEAAAVGVPCGVIVIAQNQQLIGKWATENGVPMIDATRREPASIGAAIAQLVTQATPLPKMKNGASFVVEQISTLLAARDRPVVSVRPAHEQDAHVLWEWANDPDTRRASFGRGEIPWAEHLRWLTGQLISPSAIILVAMTDGTEVGSVRFDTRDGWQSARLSYVVAPSQRGRGVSRPMVTAGVAYMRRSHPHATIQADVMHSNEASLHVFRGLGWSEEPSENSDAVRFTIAGPA